VGYNKIIQNTASAGQACIDGIVAPKKLERNEERAKGRERDRSDRRSLFYNIPTGYYIRLTTTPT